MNEVVKHNLKLWDSVSKTDVKYTKDVNQRGGYTSVSATYQAMTATEQFGEYGKGWGLKSVDYDFSMLDQIKMVICKAVFFYTIDGKEHSFPINNAINPMMGAKPDEDFCKKVETNTISKALSRLGFNADIFMGMFDDDDYVAQLKTEQDIENAENRDLEIQAKRQEASGYVLRHLELIASASSVSEVAGIQKVTIRHLERQKNIRDLADICEAGIKKIGLESEARKLQIKGETK